MAEIAELLYDVMNQTDESDYPSDHTLEDARKDCDGCGRNAPDVDLWAVDSESNEEVWLCLSCGS